MPGAWVAARRDLLLLEVGRPQATR